MQYLLQAVLVKPCTVTLSDCHIEVKCILVQPLFCRHDTI